MNWINVNDRLPEKSKGAGDLVVLVYTIYGDWCKALYNFDIKKWSRLDSQHTIFNDGEVTHWCEVTPPSELSDLDVIVKTEALLRKSGLPFTKVVHYGDNHDDRFVIHFENKRTHSFPSEEMRQALLKGKLLDYVMSSL